LPNNGPNYFVNKSRFYCAAVSYSLRLIVIPAEYFFVGKFYQQSKYIDGVIETGICNNFER